MESLLFSEGLLRTVILAGGALYEQELVYIIGGRDAAHLKAVLRLVS